ncbi:hypothetical protein [Bradyrhizobium sp. 15]|uniref:lipopolysaccharide biosynthesis protein n=1 Tax=Bradyrhizobium sp. 15 TaxID=2782633 RepID=UPI001FFAF74E|nr:hypothetical protein [Bradyrhizobium sp. 15]MCK1434943.1 hypothetical protein [Bradyrhizobium sp. 15]
MTMAVARGDNLKAERTFQSCWLLVTCFSALFILAVSSTLALIPNSYLDSEIVEPSVVRIVILLLCGQSFGILQSGLLMAAFRASGNYALGTALQGVINLLEGSGIILIAWLGGGVVLAAAGLLVVRTCGILAQSWLLATRHPGFSWGVSRASFSEVIYLARPAVAALSLPVAQASFIQGTNIAIGLAATAADVATFSAVRTLVRVGIQGVTLLNHALMPEFAAASALGERQRQLNLCILTFGWSLLVLCPFALILDLIGPSIVSIWSRGAIHPSYSLLFTMSFVMLLNGVWHPLSNLLLAINKHQYFAYPYAVFAICGVGLTYVSVHSVGILGAALSLLVLDASMLLLVSLIFFHFVAGPRELVTAIPTTLWSMTARQPVFRERT